MWLKRPGLELGMKLHADEPNVFRDLHDFRKQAIRGEAGEAQTGSFKLVAVFHVHLVTVPVTLGNPGCAIYRRDPAVLCKERFISTKPHCAAQIAALPTQL